MLECVEVFCFFNSAKQNHIENSKVDRVIQNKRTQQNGKQFAAKNEDLTFLQGSTIWKVDQNGKELLVEFGGVKLNSRSKTTTSVVLNFNFGPGGILWVLNTNDPFIDKYPFVDPANSESDATKDNASTSTTTTTSTSEKKWGHRVNLVFELSNGKSWVLLDCNQFKVLGIGI
eukprot:TRINITY_DN4019_c1_g1_i1.p1 TRINITY_DN4019_c1_g1~~TRINITY_DN4019_c1_g1_i1.p1  ORF type:complete len:173 (-),score=36.54 TRINITY_DN4019_c1_g1_i1:237-755(-)